jgi:1-phosphofructokinase family hexose kinase
VILSAGLTPAWQQILLFDAFRPGDVNRAREVHWCASGKVLNAARALHHLGADVKALTVCGGTTGEEIRRDLGRLAIPALCVETSTPTRICTTIVDAAAHAATELVPNAAELDDAGRDAFVAAYNAEAPAASVVILIGSLPVGTPDGFYRELIGRTPGKVLLDAQGPELLEALAARPFLVKPNREELERTLGRPLRQKRELYEGMREINARGAEWVVITDGHHPIHARSADRLYCLQPPPVQQVLNPIGCGDCMTAGIAWALAEGRDPMECLCWGVAAAASKLGQLLPGLLVREEVAALAQSVNVIRLSPDGTC